MMAAVAAVAPPLGFGQRALGCTSGMDAVAAELAAATAQAEEYARLARERLDTSLRALDKTTDVHVPALRRGLDEQTAKYASLQRRAAAVSQAVAELKVKRFSFAGVSPVADPPSQSRRISFRDTAIESAVLPRSVPSLESPTLVSPTRLSSSSSTPPKAHGAAEPLPGLASPLASPAHSPRVAPPVPAAPPSHRPAVPVPCGTGVSASSRGSFSGFAEPARPGARSEGTVSCLRPPGGSEGKGHHRSISWSEGHDDVRDFPVTEEFDGNDPVHGHWLPSSFTSSRKSFESDSTLASELGGRLISLPTSSGIVLGVRPG